jgi:hypothetical protein
LFKFTGLRLASAAAALLLVYGAGPAFGLELAPQAAAPAASNSAALDDCDPPVLDSPYIPVDSWVYPAVMRLYALGYVDTVYVGMRPWTRASVLEMLEGVEERVEDDGLGAVEGEVDRLYKALSAELRLDRQNPCAKERRQLRIESVYTIARGMSGTPLRDSFHLGSTIVNDYGRPYARGFNSYSGASGFAAAGRFLLYARGEFQGAPSATGYSAALGQTLANVDRGVDPVAIDPATGLPYNQATIPTGPIGAARNGRLIEAYASARVLDHEVSFGKQDDWMGPGVGGGMAYSNNAENIYAVHINRIDPLHVPGLSNLTGPFRYEFLVGSLKGHTYPNDPWVHVEKVSFRPDQNLEIGFERTVIWGGKGHEPITLHTFLRSFFSTTNVTTAVKESSADPGARFASFDFSYKLPFVRNWLTLYSDSEVHDDVSPIDAPRHAALRPGLYLSHVPGVTKLDLRVEGASTDPPDRRSLGGNFMYWEVVQQQGYTNQGQLFGDWIGREDKGGQAWVTYHLSGNEWIQASFRNQKAAKDFIRTPATPATATTPYVPAVEYGTTLNDISFQVVKRVGKDLEINGSFSYERWKAPIYLPGPQTVTTSSVQLTWFPR